MSYDELILEGYNYYSRMENEKAAEIWRKAKDLDPKRWEAYLLLADVTWHYLENGSINDAFYIALEGLNNNKDNPYLMLIIYLIKEDLINLGQNYNVTHLRHWINKIIEIEPSWIFPRLIYTEFLKAHHKKEYKKQLEILKSKQPFRYPCKNNLEEYLEAQYTGRNSGNDFDERIKDLEE